MIPFRTGWWIPGRVMALTHFEPEVTPAMQQQIFHELGQLLSEAEGPVDLLIDNRNIKMSSTVPLSSMVAAVPELKHPLLHRIVVVVPSMLISLLDGLPTEHAGPLSLSHVASLEQAIQAMGWDAGETAPGFFEP